MKTNIEPNWGSLIRFELSMEGASGFMVSAPSPRRRHYVVFLGKTLYSAHSSSLQPGV